MSFASWELLTAAVRIVSESFKTIRLERFIHDIAAILMNARSSAMTYTVWLQNTLNIVLYSRLLTHLYGVFGAWQSTFTFLH